MGKTKLDQLGEIINEYGITWKYLTFIILVDNLTKEEIYDFEYLKDRIETHLEEVSPSEI